MTARSARWAVMIAGVVAVAIGVSFAVFAVAYAVGGWGAIDDTWVGFIVVVSAARRTGGLTGRVRARRGGQGEPRTAEAALASPLLCFRRSWSSWCWANCSGGSSAQSGPDGGRNAIRIETNDT